MSVFCPRDTDHLSIQQQNRAVRFRHEHGRRLSDADCFIFKDDRGKSTEGDRITEGMHIRDLGGDV